MMSNRTIDSDLLKKILGVDVSPASFSAIGDIHSNHSNNLLTYLKEKKYIEVVLNNKFIRGVICTQEVASLLPDRIIKVIHDYSKAHSFPANEILCWYSDVIKINGGSIGTPPTLLFI